MRSLSIALSLALALAPVLSLRAAEVPEPPSLPDSAADTAEPAPAAAGNGEVSVPKEDPKAVAPGKPVADAKPSRFKFGNFALGFLGGALLGVAYGVLSSGGQENSVMVQNAAIYGGAAGLVLGGVGLMLGATTPEEASPPKVEGLGPAPLRVAVALNF